MATLTNLFKALSLAQIKDINISSLTNGQILQYDSGSNKWKNVTNLATIKLDSPDTSGLLLSTNGLKVDNTKVPVLSTTTITAADNGKYLQYTTGGWVLNSPSTSGGYSLPIATTDIIGGIKLGYTASSSTSKDYPVLLDYSNNTAYVNVPWEGAAYTADAAGGLNLLANSFSIKLDPTTSGLSLSANGLKVDNTKVPVLSTTITAADNGKYLQYTTSGWVLGSPSTGGASSIPVATVSTLGGIKLGYTADLINKKYPVVLDSISNTAYVNVPWLGTSYVVDAAGGLNLSSNSFSIKLDSTTSGLSLSTNGLKVDNAKVPVLSNFSTSDFGKYLQYTVNGWVLTNPSTSSGTLTIPVATASTLGGIKLGYTANPTSKNYPIVLDSTSNTAYVNVPWVSTSYTADTAGGLNLLANSFSIKLDSTTSGLSLSTNGLKVDNAKVPVLSNFSTSDSGKYLQYTTGGWVLGAPSSGVTLSAATTSTLGGIKLGYTADPVNKNYPVILDSTNAAYVNVPWEGVVYTADAAGGLNLLANSFSIKLDSTTSGLSLSTNGLKVDNTVIPKYYFLEILDPTSNLSYTSNGVTFSTTYLSNGNLKIASNLGKYPASVTVINRTNGINLLKAPFFTKNTSGLIIEIPSVSLASYSSGIIITMVI